LPGKTKGRLQSASGQNAQLRAKAQNVALEINHHAVQAIGVFLDGFRTDCARGDRVSAWIILFQFGEAVEVRD
jgi:hypothetical protein